MANCSNASPACLPAVPVKLDGRALKFWNIGMGKYDALGVFLRRWKFRNDAEGVELSFAQIETIIRGLLPRGAGDEAWWCVNCPADRSAPHRRVWLDAGFDAIAEPKAEKVYFRRQTEA